MLSTSLSLSVVHPLYSLQHAAFRPLSRRCGNPTPSICLPTFWRRHFSRLRSDGGDSGARPPGQCAVFPARTPAARRVARTRFVFTIPLRPRWSLGLTTPDASGQRLDGPAADGAPEGEVIVLPPRAQGEKVVEIAIAASVHSGGTAADRAPTATKEGRISAPGLQQEGIGPNDPPKLRERGR